MFALARRPSCEVKDEAGSFTKPRGVYKKEGAIRNMGIDDRRRLQGDWETSQTVTDVGTADAISAAWYLTSSRIWPLVSSRIAGKIVFGIVLFVIVVATVVLSPSTESHFIYTDF